jgi:hypothetical protein
MFLDALKELSQKLNYTKEVIIGDMKFEISLLTYEEEQKVSSLPKEEEEPLLFYEKTRSQILSYSIRKINGIEIPLIVEVEIDGKKEQKERSIYIKEEIISKIPIKIIDILFDAYIDFKEEIESKIEKEINYKWYKTPKEREKEREQRLKKEEKEEESINLKKIEEDKNDS